jgi:hypothetical protein
LAPLLSSVLHTLPTCPLLASSTHQLLMLMLVLVLVLLVRLFG